MIDFIQNASWPMFIGVYILLGLLWSDFLVFFQRKYAPTIEFTPYTKRVIVVLWPASLLIFVSVTLYTIVSYFFKSNEDEGTDN